MAGNDPTVVAGSAARTVTGNSGSQTLLDEGELLAVLLDVTAVSGTTPSMTVSVEWSQDGGTTFAQSDPADALTAITAAAQKVKSFVIKAPHYRLVWTITGTTPSFTFSARSYVTT